METVHTKIRQVDYGSLFLAASPFFSCELISKTCCLFFFFKPPSDTERAQSRAGLCVFRVNGAPGQIEADPCAVPRFGAGTRGSRGQTDREEPPVQSRHVARMHVSAVQTGTLTLTHTHTDTLTQCMCAHKHGHACLFNKLNP